MIYEFVVRRTYRMSLPFTVFGTGLTIEADVVLEVDGLSWAASLDEDDRDLDRRALWNYDDAEFRLAHDGIDENLVNLTILSDVDEATFSQWVKDIVTHKSDYTYTVDDEPRTMSRSEWEGD